MIIGEVTPGVSADAIFTVAATILVGLLGTLIGLVLRLDRRVRAMARNRHADIKTKADAHWSANMIMGLQTIVQDHEDQLAEAQKRKPQEYTWKSRQEYLDMHIALLDQETGD